MAPIHRQFDLRKTCPAPLISDDLLCARPLASLSGAVPNPSPPSPALERITLIIEVVFRPDREPSANVSALNELPRSHEDHGALAAAHDLFGRLWSPENSLLIKALVRGQITRRMLGTHTVVWPASVRCLFRGR